LTLFCNRLQIGLVRQLFAKRTYSRSERKIMKIKSLIFGVLLGTASVIQAQVLLSVDVGPGTVQSGFQNLSGGITQPTASGVFGAYTVSLSGGAGFFNAGGNGTGPFADLYGGYYYANFSAAPLNLSISGLTGGASYTLQIFSYDSGHTNSVINWSPSGSTTGTSGSVGPTPTTPVNDEYSTTLTLVADGGGNLTVQGIDAAALHPRLNGFILSAAAVPEPSTIASMGLGLAFLALRLRRRMS
jgi:hypothetical protein